MILIAILRGETTKNIRTLWTIKTWDSKRRKDVNKVEALSLKTTPTSLLLWSTTKTNPIKNKKYPSIPISTHLREIVSPLVRKNNSNTLLKLISEAGMKEPRVIT